MIGSLKRAVKNAGDPWFWPASRRELRRLIREHPGSDVEDILAIVAAYRGGGWYRRLNAMQVESELRRLVAWAAAQQPRVILEIGTAAGGTLFCWSRIAREMVISVDMPGGIHGGGYSTARARLFPEMVFDRPAVGMHLIEGDSQRAETRDNVCRVLGIRQVDILFIDADHRLPGVRRDFALWSPLVRPGGHVVLHDILPHPRMPECQVDLLWAELRDQFESSEIVDDANQGWGGIGILKMPSSFTASSAVTPC